MRARRSARSASRAASARSRARGRRVGEGPGGFGLRLAGGLDGRELAGGLLAGGGEGFLACAAGPASSAAARSASLPGVRRSRCRARGGRIAPGGCLRGLAPGCLRARASAALELRRPWPRTAVPAHGPVPRLPARGPRPRPGRHRRHRRLPTPPRRRPLIRPTAPRRWQRALRRGAGPHSASANTAATRPGLASATCADTPVASRDNSVSSCISRARPASGPVCGRRRDRRRLAAHRVVVPVTAIVAAELACSTPLAGRQRPTAPRPLAVSAAAASGNPSTIGHHVVVVVTTESPLSLHFISFRVSGRAGTRRPGRKEKRRDQATSPPPSRAS